MELGVGRRRNRGPGAAVYLGRDYAGDAILLAAVVTAYAVLALTMAVLTVARRDSEATGHQTKSTQPSRSRLAHSGSAVA